MKRIFYILIIAELFSATAAFAEDRKWVDCSLTLEGSRLLGIGPRKAYVGPVKVEGDPEEMSITNIEYAIRLITEQRNLNINFNEEIPRNIDIHTLYIECPLKDGSISIKVSKKGENDESY